VGEKILKIKEKKRKALFPGGRVKKKRKNNPRQTRRRSTRKETRQRKPELVYGGSLGKRERGGKVRENGGRFMIPKWRPVEGSRAQRKGNHNAFETTAELGEGKELRGEKGLRSVCLEGKQNAVRKKGASSERGKGGRPKRDTKQRKEKKRGGEKKKEEE